MEKSDTELLKFIGREEREVGIFFEEDTSKQYPKSKTFIAVQCFLVIGIMICILMSVIQSETDLIGVSFFILCGMFALDGIHMYKATRKWAKSNLFSILLFLLTGILLLFL